MPYCRASARGRTLSAAMPRGKRLTVFCAHSFWQSLAGGRFPPHAPRDFLHGGRAHKSAVQWLLCAYGLFAGLRQGSGQFPPQCLQGTAIRLSPFVWAVRRIPGRKKIPYPVSFGIRHFEKGVNERGISPASRSVPVRTGIYSLPLPGSPGWAVPIWRTCCRGYWQGPANQR